MQPKTEQVKEQLVRYIRDNKLSVGSKMPSQNTLRAYCGVGASTVIAAINQLGQDGVLKIIPRVGVFVLAPNADGHVSRRIGVVGKIPVFTPFQAIFLEYLDFFMRKENCQTIKFWRKGTSYDENYGFEEYPGLKRMMIAGELDALIVVMQPLADEIRQLADDLNIPVFGYSVDNMHENSIVHDHEYVARESVGKLKKMGCKRPIFFSISTARYKHLMQVYQKEMQKYYPDQANTAFDKNIFQIHDMDLRKNNLRELIAKRISEINDLPEELYPDCLLLPDDIISVWVIEIMWQTGCKWKPEILMLCNTQLPLHIISSKFGKWELDIAEEARLMTEKALHMLSSGKTSFAPLRTKPVFVPAE